MIYNDTRPIEGAQPAIQFEDGQVSLVFDTFMREDGLEDPRDLGLVESDGLHPTRDRSGLMAELFRILGYGVYDRFAIILF